jgi:uncharacterized membrane protein (Fun14 family)
MQILKMVDCISIMMVTWLDSASVVDVNVAQIVELISDAGLAFGR